MFLYLFLNLAALAIPFAFSFERRLQFYRLWKPLFLSIGIVGLFFVAWDWLFTRMQVWGFNPSYVTGIHFFGLPLEEYLFFICVPYASVFTFHVFRTLMPAFNIPLKPLRFTIITFSSLLIISGMACYMKWYTCTTFILAGVSLFLSLIYFKELLPHFVLSYAAILLPFFIMNGILTGTGIEGEVVWYNDNENLGVRILTIPLEDIFYGLCLILWNINLTDYFTRLSKVPISTDVRSRN